MSRYHTNGFSIKKINRDRIFSFFSPLPKLTIGTSKSFIRGKSLSVDGHTHPYTTLTGIPSTFNPSVHTHQTGDITNLKEELEMVGSNGGKLVWTGYTTVDGIRNIDLTINLNNTMHGSKSLSIPQCDYITFVYYWKPADSIQPCIIEYPMTKGTSISMGARPNNYPVLIYNNSNASVTTALVASLNQNGTTITFDITVNSSRYSIELFTTIHAYKY